jgi:hypothetical protein
VLPSSGLPRAIGPDPELFVWPGLYERASVVVTIDVGKIQVQRRASSRLRAARLRTARLRTGDASGNVPPSEVRGAGKRKSAGAQERKG